MPSRKGTSPESNLPARIAPAFGIAAGSEESGPIAATQEPERFFIVAAGGGAGSVNAFTQILARLPKKAGPAFLFLSRDDSPARQNLVRFLSDASILPVVEVKGRTELVPNTIYLAAKGQVLQVTEQGRAVTVKGRKRVGTPGYELDALFHSLATEAHERAIGILLSGKGTDGVLGLAEIKAEGGIVFVQNPESAVESEMLTRAIASAVTDYSMSPRRIGEEVVRLAGGATGTPGGDGDTHRDQNHYLQIYTLLRALTGVDFTHYKQSTLKRRIHRRMMLKKQGSIEEYIRLLQQNPAEADALFQDILINVTSFFRDAEVFPALRKRIFPRLFKGKDRNNPVRVWVPGCSTGEEVYSIAIALLEYAGTSHQPAGIQIFATDISETALQSARAGIYPESIQAQVSPERLRRFFQKIEGGAYQITKYVRDLCVFARQNLFEDPPFSRLDLISCRNVLIYLGPQLQKKVIPIFHYALRPGGYLLLGGSETIGVFSELFTLADKKNRIYLRRTVSTRPEVAFTPRVREEEIAPVPVEKQISEDRQPATDMGRQVDRLLLAHYAPGGVLVNARLDVLQFRGHTGAFIEHSPGEASLNLLKLVRPALAMELRPLLSRALKIDMPVRKEGVRYHDGKSERLARIDVIPFRSGHAQDKFLLVLFADTGSLVPHGGTETSRRAKKKQVLSQTERELARLREELLSTKESLQAIIEEQEATNEELKSANEEIQSSNEELQSTNEELETAKEELQSSNEELTTLNEELQTRNIELSQANNDLNNLLSSVNLPILMLGNDLTIRRFTPLAEKFFNVIPTDIGRRVSDINTTLKLPDLADRVADVIDTLRTHEYEVQDRTGRWFSLRIRPYRTSDNKIDGAVLVLVDINEFKAALELVTEIIRDPLLILSGDFRVLRANHAFYETFRITREQAEGKPVYSLQGGDWKIPGLRALLEGMLPEKKRVENFQVQHRFSSLGERTLSINACLIHQESKGTQLVLLAIEDVTQAAHGKT